MPLRHHRRLAAAAAAAAAAALLAGPATAAVGVASFASGLASPLFATGRGNELFVVQQGGTIVAIDRSSKAQRTFFTVPGIETGGEKGLLGFAFDPNFSRNGRFYVDVTARVGGQLVTQVRRYTDASKGTEAPLVITQINQPYDNHNGGWIAFGPDKKLYVALGDGGSANDPQNNAQNLSVDLGKILRLDVSRDAFPNDPTRNYAVPAGNPFGTEVFAYGLRNPFRDSFDTATGDLFLGDVGQDNREEVDVIRAGTSGQNFGWRPVEGNIKTPGIKDPVPANAVAPILTYDHGTGKSITGGYVFHGSKVTELQNKYVFGDFIAGKLFTANPDGTGFTDITSVLGGLKVSPSSFAQDGNGNLYLIDYSGSVYSFREVAGARTASRLAGAASPDIAVSQTPEPASWALLIAGFAATGLAARRQRRQRPA